MDLINREQEVRDQELRAKHLEIKMKEELLWQQMQSLKNIPPPPQTQRQESFPPSKIPRPKLIPPLHITDSQPQMKGKLVDSRGFVKRQNSAPSMVFV